MNFSALICSYFSRRFLPFVCVFVVFTNLSCGDIVAKITGTASSNMIYGTINVAPVYPIHGINWMDYITNSGGGGTAYSRPDSACIGTELNYYGCLHGGELKTFAATGFTSCAGLIATDSLGAFSWMCNASTNPVTFYSRGLNPGMGLKNLITSAGWISNNVTVFSAGTPVFQTPSSVWWSNQVLPLPTNPLITNSPILLNSPGTIYYGSTSTTTSGYDLNGPASNKIAIVTLGASILSYSGYAGNWCVQYTGAIGAGSKAILCGGSSKFNWIEGRFKGATAAVADAIYFGDAIVFARLHNIEILGNAQVSNGITLDASVVNSNQSNMIDGSSVHDVTNVGFNTLNQTNFDATMNSISSNNGGYGFWIGANSPLSRKILYNVVASNNAGGGIDVDPNDQFFSVIQATAFNNAIEGFGLAGNYGMYQAITSTQNKSYQFFYHAAGNPYLEVFNNFALASANNMAVGLYLQSPNNTLIGDVLAAYSSVGIQVDVSQVSFLADGLLVGQNAIDCSNLGAATTIDPNPSNTCHHGPGLTKSPITGIDPVNSFVGIPTSNDLFNGSLQVHATTIFPPTDWIDFTNMFRGWGLGVAGSLFNFALNGNCVATNTCQIYDWSLKAADPWLLNYYGVFPTSGGACPASVDATLASNVLVNFDSTPIHYLRAAIEVMDPIVNPNGNYNGVCETGEVCIYTPNLGSYQGSGDITTRTCAPFKGGNGVTGVTLLAYPVNGN